jgi:hypothetical protein
MKNIQLFYSNFYFCKKTRLEAQHRNMQTNFDDLEQREAKIAKEKREITKEVKIRVANFVFKTKIVII